MNFGEADRILTLYSADRGKVRAIAKGARRARSHTSGHLDLFTRCNFLLAQGRSLDIISQVESIEHFPHLRQDLLSAGYANYISELVDAFAPDKLPSIEIYECYLQTLRTFTSGDQATKVRAFEVTFLDLLGYRPELHHCLGCGRDIKPERNWFSSGVGGVLCSDCRDQDVSAKEISISALKLLRNLQRNPQRVIALESVDVGVAREIENRLRDYISYRLEHRPKSVAVIDTLRTRLLRQEA